MLSSSDNLLTLALFSGALIVGSILVRDRIISQNNAKKTKTNNETEPVEIDARTVKAAAANRDENYRSKNENIKFEISQEMKSELDLIGISDDEQVNPQSADENIKATAANNQIELFIKNQVSKEHNETNISGKTICISLDETSIDKTEAIASLLSRIWSLIQKDNDNSDIIEKLIEAKVLQKPGTNLFSIIEAIRCFYNTSNEFGDTETNEIVVHNLRHGDVSKLLEFTNKLAQKEERVARTSRDIEEVQAAFRNASNIFCHIGTISGLHDINEAINAIDRAIAFDRDNPYAWDRLGDISWQLGNYKTAEKAFTRALLLSNRKENKILTMNASTRLAQIYRGREDEQLADHMDNEIKYIIKEVNPEKESISLITVLKTIAKNRVGKSINIGGAAGWQAATK